MSAEMTQAEQFRALLNAGVPNDKAMRQVYGMSMLDAMTADTKAVAPRRGRMNKTEAKRAAELELMKRSGLVRSWCFEGLRFLIADGEKKAWFCPDFLVDYVEYGLVIEETKGFWREAARLRIKVAAERYPQFQWRALRLMPAKQGGGWEIENFPR